MASTVTVTGIIGPAQAVSAQVFNNVTYFTFNSPSEILELSYDNGEGRRITQISIAAAATLTLTTSGSDYTLTVAN